VVHTERKDPRVDYLLEKSIPFVCHGRTENTEGYAFVDMDGEAAGRIATKQLIELGHRKIAFIGPPSSRLTFAWHRISGYLKSLEEAGIPVRRNVIVEGDGGEALGIEATKKLLDLPEQPSAIVCATDLEAIGALRVIAERGLVAGSDIAVIGHDDLPEASLTRPPLATIRQPHAAVGIRLAEIVAALAAGDDPAHHQEIWQPELIARESLGKLET
jgi:LacI family transcriptional regulator